MDALLGAAAYLLALLAFVFVLLCGENELFARTPLPRLHYWLTQGGCDAAEFVAARCCGARGAAALQRTAECCCERSNPTVQILFVALLGGCYWTAWHHVFPLLPLPGVPAWHRATGTAAALSCLALFALASFADPGTVTPANAAAHAALYRHDGQLYRPKRCATCRLPRPARSKHCTACGRCVARLDHHCIWLNACVGLGNMRWFLAFLAATATLCAYAATIGVLVLLRDMEAQGTWATAFLHPDSGRLVYLGDSWRYALPYLTSVYGPQVAFAFFTAAAGCIVAGFLAYQLRLLCLGTTTREVHKRRVAAHAAALEVDAAAQEERVAAALAGPAAGQPQQGPRQGAGQAPQPPRQAGRRHPYDRGAWRNLSEVLWPHHHLRLAAAQAQAAASAGAGAGNDAKRE